MSGRKDELVSRVFCVHEMRLSNVLTDSDSEELEGKI